MKTNAPSLTNAFCSRKADAAGAAGHKPDSSLKLAMSFSFGHQRPLACSPRRTKQVELALVIRLPF
jgi:hypothetical protein